MSSSCLPQQICNFPSNLLTRFDETAKQFTSVTVTFVRIVLNHRRLRDSKFGRVEVLASRHQNEKNNRILLLYPNVDLLNIFRSIKNSRRKSFHNYTVKILENRFIGAGHSDLVVFYKFSSIRTSIFRNE